MGLPRIILRKAGGGEAGSRRRRWRPRRAGRKGRQAEEAALQYHRAGRASWMAAEQSDYIMSLLAQEPPVSPHHPQDKPSQALLLGVGARADHSPNTHLASPYSLAELFFTLQAFLGACCLV